MVLIQTDLCSGERNGNRATPGSSLGSLLGLFRTSIQHSALVSYWHLHVSSFDIKYTTISNDFTPFLGSERRLEI